MKKDALTQLGVSDEIAEKIISLHNDELNGFVPKTRLDEAIGQRETYKKDYDDAMTKLGELSKSAKDVDSLKKELDSLKETNQKQISDYETKISQMALDNAVELALTKEGAKNTKAVKALMSDFLADAKLEGESIKGFTEAITKLKETDGYLFNDSSDKGFKGSTPKGGSGGDPQQKTSRSVFEAQLAEARKNGNTVEAIRIKQQASEQGISLL